MNGIFSLIFLVLIHPAHGLENKTILLDPGHGGKESGAHVKRNGSDIKEKDIAMKVSKMVYKRLKKKYRVFLTRSFDKTLSLEDRAKLADTVNADIFVSIHANSSETSTHASGFETYYLDNHDSAASRKVERIENISSSGKEMIIQKILIDLVIERTSKDSKKLSSLIHSNIKNDLQKKYKLRDRGVKPGLFFVLALSKRPAALIEIGFMTNSKDRKNMQDKEFLESYAKAIADGIEAYFTQKT